MSYTILIAKSVQKQINALPADIKTRVVEKIKQLESEPRPAGAIKMKGSEQEYRIRIGDYRVRYDVDDTNQVLRLLQCKHRREVYKK
jgi:mRNA interferase RelE/StbE